MRLSKRDEAIARDWETGIMRDMIPKFIKVWKDESYNAIDQAELPQVEESFVWWAVALAANALAFAAPFFPAIAAIGIVSSAMAAAGMFQNAFDTNMRMGLAGERQQRQVRVGLTLSLFANGLNIINQLSRWKGRISSGPNAKTFLQESIAIRADQLIAIYRDAAPQWTRDMMIPTYHWIEANKYNKNKVVNYSNWAENGGLAAIQREQFVWDNLIFLNMKVPYHTQNYGLQALMRIPMQKLTDKFNQEWEAWFRKAVLGVSAVGAGGILGAVNIPSPANVSAYAKVHPFEPSFNFDDLPAYVQPLIDKVKTKDIASLVRQLSM